jgi:hypothetical protein
MKPANTNMLLERQIALDFSGVAEFYSNTFEDYFMVNIQQADIFILQSFDGKLIGEYKVVKGETRVSENLSKDVYIGRLINQGITFKIVRR